MSLKKIFSRTIKRDNKEFAANISFAEDINMSPNGVDRMSSTLIDGKKELEVCTKLDNGNFLIEKFIDE